MSKKQIENKATDKSELARKLVQTQGQNALLSIDMLNGRIDGQDMDTMKAVVNEQRAIIDRVRGGDMADMEALLVGQALTLQAMFTKYGGLINANTNNLKACQAVFNMAMKAQAQSRATVQALVELKYPKSVVITKQANISHGHQQVNNGVDGGGFDTSTRARTHAGKIQNEPNELYRSIDNDTTGERMDSRAQGTHGRTDKDMETVATQHGRKNSRG